MDAPVSLAPADPVGGTPGGRRQRPRPGLELGVLGVVGVLLAAAFIAGGASLYREFYSPTAFVLRYLDLLAEGRAGDARAVPGVDLDADALEKAGLSANASDALLRSSVLAPLSDIEAVSEEADGDVTRVSVRYRVGGTDGQTTFEVQQQGWIGPLPQWRFATSPLAVVDLTVRGSMRFDVNDFAIDKRQIAGDAVDPLASLPLLVFSPGLYSISVDTAISATPGVAVLADAPRTGIPVDIQAEPTDEFVSVVQQRVDEFLAACATQQVLQPTGCPFGFQVRNRIVGEPAWSIVAQPEVRVEPDGAAWKIVPADATAHIDVTIRSLFDGSVRDVSEDVPFVVSGSITVLADGTASIQVAGGNAP
ncbi:hypothetical protein ACIQLJ_03620 [Microbacterium sp. NPDC091313]